MRQSPDKRRNASASVRQMSDAGGRVSAFLRRLYPCRTADQVAADTGIKSATVAKWLERESAPNGSAMLILIACYGPDFLGAVMERPPAWLVQQRRAAEVAQALADIARLKATLLGEPDAD